MGKLFTMLMRSFIRRVDQMHFIKTSALLLVLLLLWIPPACGQSDGDFTIAVREFGVGKRIYNEAVETDVQSRKTARYKIALSHFQKSYDKYSHSKTALFAAVICASLSQAQEAKYYALRALGGKPRLSAADKEMAGRILKWSQLDTEAQTPMPGGDDERFDFRPPEGSLASDGSNETYVQATPPPRQASSTDTRPPPHSATDFDIPQFPWPPPKASTSVMVPDELLNLSRSSSRTFGEIDDRIRSALLSADYTDISYYRIPGGFVLITRIEQIQKNGLPMTGTGRWDVNLPPMHKFSLHEYVAALFEARSGYFRVIAFVVTPAGFAEANVPVSRDEAIGWVYSGANKLSAQIRGQSTPVDTKCTALVYEFENINGTPSFTNPGRLTAKRHLEQTKIFFTP